MKIEFKLTEEREQTIQVKRDNDRIVHGLYLAGKCKYNPYADKNEEYYEGCIISIHKNCPKIEQPNIAEA